jgi:hypothetical protein
LTAASTAAKRLADLVEIAAGRNHPVACLKGCFCSRSADPAAGTGDEPDLAHVSFQASMIEKMDREVRKYAPRISSFDQRSASALYSFGHRAL